MNFLLFLLSIGLLTINSEKIQSGSLFTKSFCKELKRTEYAGHYNLIQLKCEWHPFLNYLHDNANLTGSINEASNMYEIEFTRKSPYSLSTQTNPFEISSNLFKNYRVRKLILSDLEIKVVHPAAFKNCCEKTLEYLDLSRNKLKRIDFDVLEHLKVLEYLNLGLNQDLKLANENFKENKMLKSIGLSSNNLEYLPERIFKNLEGLEKIDLSNNSLKNLDACSFYPTYSNMNIKSSPAANKISNVIIDASLNNIQCDCNVFFLERAANFKFNLTCSGKPDQYNGKHLNELFREDPSKSECLYKDIQFNCKSKYEDSNSLLKKYEYYEVLVIIFSTLFSIFCCASLCLCCRLRNVERKIQEVDGNIETDPPKQGYSLVATTPKENAE